jgi:hypothetical protein
VPTLSAHSKATMPHAEGEKRLGAGDFDRITGWDELSEEENELAHDFLML